MIDLRYVGGPRDGVIHVAERTDLVGGRRIVRRVGQGLYRSEAPWDGEALEITLRWHRGKPALATKG